MSSDMFVCKNCDKIFHIDEGEVPSKCPHCGFDPTQKGSVAPASSPVKDFFGFKVFITHRIVSGLWNLIVSFSCCWLFFAELPSFWWRLGIAVAVILVTRVFFEFVVVLFSIGDMIRELRDIQKKKPV